MGDPYMTGRKRRQKLYRHHTGYPGGLKEYTWRHVLETNQNRILISAIKGMLPKGRQRDMLIVDNIQMFSGPYHTLSNILPQFKEQAPEDINLKYGIEALDKESTVIEYHSANELPSEFKDYKTQFQPEWDVPHYMMEKTHKVDYRNKVLGQAYRKSYKNYRRYKEHRHDDKNKKS